MKVLEEGRAQVRARFRDTGQTSFCALTSLLLVRASSSARRRRRNSLVKGFAAVRDPEPLVWGWRARRAIGRLTVVRGGPDRAKCSCQGPSAAKGPVEGIVAVRVAKQQCTPLRVRGGRNFFGENHSGTNRSLQVGAVCGKTNPCRLGASGWNTDAGCDTAWAESAGPAVSKVIGE